MTVAEFVLRAAVAVATLIGTANSAHAAGSEAAIALCRQGLNSSSIPAAAQDQHCSCVAGRVVPALSRDQRNLLDELWSDIQARRPPKPDMLARVQASGIPPIMDANQKYCAEHNWGPDLLKVEGTTGFIFRLACEQGKPNVTLEAPARRMKGHPSPDMRTATAAQMEKWEKAPRPISVAITPVGGVERRTAWRDDGPPIGMETRMLSLKNAGDIWPAIAGWSSVAVAVHDTNGQRHQFSLDFSGRIKPGYRPCK